jgi:hypothetical protein
MIRLRQRWETIVCFASSSIKLGDISSEWLSLFGTKEPSTSYGGCSNGYYLDPAIRPLVNTPRLWIIGYLHPRRGCARDPSSRLLPGGRDGGSSGNCGKVMQGSKGARGPSSKSNNCQKGSQRSHRPRPAQGHIHIQISIVPPPSRSVCPHCPPLRETPSAHHLPATQL